MKTEGAINNRHWTYKTQADDKQSKKHHSLNTGNLKRLHKHKKPAQGVNTGR
jgi:hypothetical protein